MRHGDWNARNRELYGATVNHTNNTCALNPYRTTYLQLIQKRMELPQIGDKLRFPDGDIAIITKLIEYRDEEDDEGTYDAIQVIFVIEGDSDKQEFDEMLDSRDGYKFHIMKPIAPTPHTNGEEVIKEGI